MVTGSLAEGQAPTGGTDASIFGRHFQDAKIVESSSSDLTPRLRELVYQSGFAISEVQRLRLRNSTYSVVFGATMGNTMGITSSASLQ